jgi:YihY family inner membrane protein
MRSAARRIFDFYWGEGIADDVPALTYYLVLSLAPFALGIAAVQALLLNDLLSAIEVSEQLNRFLPDAIHEEVKDLIVNTRDNSPLLLGLAVAAMLWTTSGAIGVIERCESRMLDCPRHNVVVGRIRNMVLGAAVGVLFALAAASAPTIGDIIPSVDFLPGGPSLLFNALGSVVVFTVVYRYAPRSVLGWRASFLGALPAGVAIQAIPALVGLYFDAAAGFQAAQIFLLLAVLLFGLYAMALALLLGAGVAVKLDQRRREREARLVPPAAGRPPSAGPAPERVPAATPTAAASTK